MSNSSFIGQAHSFIFFSLQRLVDILSTRDPMTGDLLFTVTNCIDRVKLTLYVMITHLIYITTMSFVTVVTTPYFSTIPTYMCMSWPLFLLKVCCSSNWRCHGIVYTPPEDLLYTNHKQLRDGKGNAALQELSKHLSCLALKDSPTHRLDRNPNLAHRILPFCTKGVKMTSIRRRYIIN